MSKNDKEGKILTIIFTFEKQLFQVINIYAPTTPSFRSKFFKTPKHYTNTPNKHILARDFNMVEDLNLDRQEGNPSKSHQIGLTNLEKNKRTK